MTAVPNVPARQVLVDAITPHLPKRWHLIDNEAPADDSDRTRIRVSQRTITHAGTGKSDMHTIEFQLVVTVPTGDGLEAAETQLDDDVNAFLHALDAAGVPWTTATKGRYSDEGDRLGYTVAGVEMMTNPNTEGTT